MPKQKLSTWHPEPLWAILPSPENSCLAMRIGIFRTMDPAPQLRVACAGCHPCSVYVTRSTSKRCLEDPLSKVGGNSRFYHDYCATRTDDLREWPLHELTAWSCSSHQSIYIYKLVVQNGEGYSKRPFISCFNPSRTVFPSSTYTAKNGRFWMKQIYQPPYIR